MPEVYLFQNGPFSLSYPMGFVGKSFFGGNIEYKFTNFEQYIAFEKAMLFKDIKTARKIMNATELYEIEEYTRTISYFDETVWREYQEHVVRNGNYYKFSQNESLKQLILNTGSKILAEATPYDYFWGCGYGASHPYAKKPKKWMGLNLLGKSLMIVRAQIRLGTTLP